MNLNSSINFKIVPVSEPRSGDERRSKLRETGKAFSLWEIGLTEAIDKSPVESYVRVRFRVSGLARVWIWRSHGALFDMRVMDSRESVRSGESKHLDDLKNRIRPIPPSKLNAFACVPTWLEPRYMSPEPIYVRLLEGEQWQKYLLRRLGLRYVGSRKILVYQFQNRARISLDDPFRAFVQFGRPRASIASLEFVFLIVLFFLGGCLVGILSSSPAISDKASHWLSAQFRDSWNGLISLGLIGIIGTLVTIWKRVTELISLKTPVLRWLDDLFYKISD